MDKIFLEQRLKEVREKFHLPALALSVDCRGENFTLATGIRKAGEEATVTPQDKFHMGSCGKSVTAALIHVLAADGHIALNQTLQEALPNITIAPAWRGVTLEQLLTHTSGLPENYADTKRLFELATQQTPTETRRFIAREMLAVPPQTAPTGAHAYTNIGYVLLGLVAEEAAGAAYEYLVQARIFAPLGADSIGFGAATGAQPVGHGHAKDHVLTPYFGDNPPAYAPAGTMHAALPDWMKFLKSRLHHMPPSGVVRSGGGEYTDAAQIKSADGSYGHDGSNTINYARVCLWPSQDACFIIASNDGMAAQPAVMELSADIRAQIKPPS